ncbi:MAG TPA: hypothetical protein VFZ66_17080 [Herpetosiphonaceae bacterium]
MTLTRLLGFCLALVLFARLLPMLAWLGGERWRRSMQRLTITVDVAGGFILLAIVLSVLLRGEPLGALLLAVIGIPVFIGTYRALPSWWRGYKD